MSFCVDGSDSEAEEPGSTLGALGSIPVGAKPGIVSSAVPVPSPAELRPVHPVVAPVHAHGPVDAAGAGVGPAAVLPHHGAFFPGSSHGAFGKSVEMMGMSVGEQMASWKQEFLARRISSRDMLGASLSDQDMMGEGSFRSQMSSDWEGEHLEGTSPGERELWMSAYKEHKTPTKPK